MILIAQKNLTQRTKIVTLLRFVLAFALATNPLYALPVDGVVAGGAADISSVGNDLNVNQATDRAIIDWKGFDIAADERATFNQPSVNSVTLNRVNGGANASQILGQLNSNGTLMLVNSNGVVFGAGSQVNVGGLIATSSNIDNAKFMSGDYSFDQAGNPDSEISNAGIITARDGGLVGLVAPNVSNSGVIKARLGKVQLASGDTFAVDLYGDGLIQLQASDNLKKQLVNNSGTINADGGEILMTAAAAKNTVNSVINMDGILQANSVGSKNGKVTLYAQGSNAVKDNVAANKGIKTGKSTVIVTGKIKATGNTGGEVNVLADQVGIFNGADIDASGTHGGGTVRIGGDYLGQGTTPTAQRTIVQSNTKINASAIENGDGGKVTVWADNRTDFNGTIEAKGGVNGGNGGFVETSGKQTLSATGNVVVSAPAGNGGTWLLDPSNISISAVPTSTSVDSSFTSTANDAVVAVSSIESVLNSSGNVTITTGAGFQAGNIYVGSTITKSAGTASSLTLRAAASIFFVDGADIISTAGPLNVTLNSAKDAVAGLTNAQLQNDTTNFGGVYLNDGNTIKTNGGNIVIGGGSDPSTMPSHAIYISTTISRTNIPLTGVLINNSTLDATGGGNITINGQSQQRSLFGKDYDNPRESNGVFVSNSTIKTDAAGTIKIDGNGGGFQPSGITAGSGVKIVGSTIETASGAIDITGKTLGGVSSNSDILLSGSIIKSTSGAINFKSSTASGILFDYFGAANTIGDANTTGDISFIANTVYLDNFNGPASPITTTGNVTFNTHTAGRAITVGVSNFSPSNASKPLELGAKLLNNIRAGSLIIGNTTNGGAITANQPSSALVNLASAGNVKFLSAGNISFTGSFDFGANTFLAHTSAGSISLAAGRTLTSTATGNAITLAASNGGFTNGSANANAISTPNGRWLVYSRAPSTTTLNGLNPSFTKTGCVYGGACSGLGEGTGVIYQFKSILVATPNVIHVDYGDAVPALTNYAYTLTGYTGGDEATDMVSGSLNGSTNYISGSGAFSYAINYASGTLTSTSGYGFDYANAATALVVDPLAVTATFAPITKVYDGTVSASVGAFTLTGKNAAANAFIANDVISYGIRVTSGTAAFDTTNVGINKTVEVTSLTLGDSYSGIFSGNYRLASTASGLGEITKRDLTVTATGTNKVYDGNLTAAVTLSDNRISGDVFTDTYTSALFGNKNVGDGKTVNVTGISIGTSEAANNYNLTNTSATTTANITQRDLNVFASDRGKVYDGNTNAVIGLSDDRVMGDVFADNYTSATYGSKNAGFQIVTVSGMNISNIGTGTDANNYRLVNTTYITKSQITQRDLTITLNSSITKAYDGTTTAPIAFSDNRISGDVFSDTFTSGGYNDKNVGVGKFVFANGVGIANIGSGTDANNYRVISSNFLTGRGDITPRDLIVSATGSNKVYDGNTTDAVTLTDNRIVGDQIIITSAGGNFDDANAGTNKNVTVSGINLTGIIGSPVGEGTPQPDPALNYRLVSRTANTTANITPASLLVTADNKNVVSGGTLPNLTFTFGQLVGSDTSSIFSGLLSTVPASSAAGDYAIAQGSLSAGTNYAMNFVNGVLTITPAPASSSNVPTNQLNSVTNETNEIDPVKPPAGYNGTLLSLQTGGDNGGNGGNPNDLNNINPAAGGDEGNDLNAINPAAGGNGNGNTVPLIDCTPESPCNPVQ